MPKLYWTQEDLDNYSEIQDLSDQELINWLAELVDEGGDVDSHNVMYELTQRLGFKNSEQKMPANVNLLKIFQQSGYLFETENDFILEYPSNKKALIDKGQNDII
tara:strand:+ start:487 stop:801 length:315 start_codon:yes stop_codon:yes gene_type:complete